MSSPKSSWPKPHAETFAQRKAVMPWDRCNDDLVADFVTEIQATQGWAALLALLLAPIEELAQLRRDAAKKLITAGPLGPSLMMALGRADSRRGPNFADDRSRMILLHSRWRAPVCFAGACHLASLEVIDVIGAARAAAVSSDWRI